MCKLPEPHYHRDASDPEWLVFAAQFHGHLGPWAAAGIRLGMAAREAVGARGHFDIEVTCEGPLAKPPRSCLLDGLQVATGATLGKRNLHWVQGDKIVLQVKNTRTGDRAEVRPTPTLLELVASFTPRPIAQRSSKPGGDDPVDPALETIARKIAAAPMDTIREVTFPV